MSRDPAADAERWIAQAASDLDDARLLIEHGRASTACFLAQQAAEKALKGALYGAGADVVLGHSVRALCDEVVRIAPEVEAECARWALLDQYYIPTRYPDALPGGIPAEAYSPDQADAAITTAAEVLAFARRRSG